MSGAGLIIPKVLLIDDNEDDRFKIRWMLSRERRVTLYEASSADEGLSMWQKVHPDLVLLDLSLPDGRGEEIMRTARMQRWGNPIVVAVSGLSLPERVSELALAGVSSFLPKDRLTQDLLSAAITTAFERSQQRKRTQLEQLRLDEAARTLSGQLSDAADELQTLGQPISEEDTPPIRLLKGMLQRRSADLAQLARSLAEYANVEPINPQGQTSLGAFHEAISGLFTSRIQWDSDLDLNTPLAVDVEDLAAVVKPMIENAIRHDQQIDTQICMRVTDEGHEVHITLTNLHPGLSALWQLESDALFLLGRVVGDRSAGRLGQGLAGVIKRLRNGPIQLAVSLDPLAGFSLILKIPKGPRTR